jgi:hypothetical protein
VSNSLNPGNVLTDIVRDYHWILRLGFAYVGPYILRDPMQGALTTLFVAVHPSIQTEHIGGSYFDSCAEQEASDSARDPALARALWDHTEMLLTSMS